MRAKDLYQTLDPDDLSAAIDAGWRDYLLRQGQPARKADRVYASRWTPCTRQMVLEMTEGDKRPAWDADTLAKFAKGNDRERDNLADLKRIGRHCEPQFEVIGEQERFTLNDRKGREVISGKIDAKLHIKGWHVDIPLEHKDWNFNLTTRIHRFEDCFENRWTRRGAYQLLAYLLGSGAVFGIMVLDRPGIPKILPVHLYPYLDQVEDFLTRAEEAIDHKEANTLPEYIRDAEECKYCWMYGSLCNPPISAFGTQIIPDEEVETMLERREELQEAAKEYGRLDRTIKDKFRGLDGAICGSFVLKGKWQRSTTYEIPDEIKAKYKKVDPKGRYKLEITKLES